VSGGGHDAGAGRPAGQVSRRAVLALVGALPLAQVAACSAGAPPAPAERRAIAPSSIAPPPPPPPPPLAPAASRWLPGPGEVAPEVKRTAAAFLEVAGSWLEPGSAVASLTRAGARPQVAATAEVLRVPGATASALTVAYPQYGGLTVDAAAVIAVAEQRLQTPGGEVRRDITVDVRLVRDPAGRWSVEEIRPTTSLGAAIPLSRTASAVLADPRLVLPGPARADVATGRMDDLLLSILLGLAEEFTLAIQVMHTGHIQTVFPTPRLSNHAVGRAVDIRAVNGNAVVDPAMSAQTLEALMRHAADLGATEVGGPRDLNGDRKGFFSDSVHQDHIHLGVTPGDPPAHLR
jgi:hypothetical protein